MEGDAGASRLNPTIEGQEPEPNDPVEAVTEEPTDTRRLSRLGTGWVASICLILVLLAAGAAAGGYFALRANHRADALARSDQAALQAAKDCVAATQAPDTAAMTAAQSKILQCSTGDFGVQAGLYSSVVAEAYQAAKATVAVDELRAAVERHNDDGSVNVLVAVRVKISNSEAADQQVGYRLRATMAFDEGQYRIAKLDQVTS
jgi:Mce-associated membrane protein